MPVPSLLNMPNIGQDKTPKSSKKKKLTHSHSFRGLPNNILADSFKREDELRHSTGSMKGNYAVGNNIKVNVKLVRNQNETDEFRGRCNSDTPKSVGAKKNKNLRDEREKSCSTPEMDVTEDTPSHSVSNLIRGFQSKINDTPTKTPRNRQTSEESPYNSRNGLSPGGSPVPPDKHKRVGSKRKLSIRKRNKANEDASDILRKLGISPLMGSESRTSKKAVGHLDVQSLTFDISNAVTLKTQLEQGGSRQKNVSTGASAATKRTQRRTISRAESMIDDGDEKSNELVLSCPYFRNEIAEEESVEDKLSPTSNANVFLDSVTRDMSQVWSNFSKNRSSSFEILPKSNSASDLEKGSHRHSSISQPDISTDLTLLEPMGDSTQFYSWDDPKMEAGKRIFEFEHIDRGALYYRQFFHGKGK